MNHVPVILLTAKGDYESEKYGLTLKADDYLTKPFSPILLQQKIRNRMETLLAQRAHLKNSWLQAERYRDVKLIKDPFLLSLFKQLENNFSSSGFGVNELALNLHFHAKTLNRRCQSILGKNTKNVISQFRIEQAKKQMMNGVKLISVAQACGYSDQAHFSGTFKTVCGLSPSQWVENINKLPTV